MSVGEVSRLRSIDNQFFRFCLLLPFVFFTQPELNANETQDQRYKSLESLARGIYFLENLYVDPSKIDQGDMVTQALDGIVKNLDPHTLVMPKKAFKQLTTETKGKFGGVGIIVSQERGKVIVISPIEDTPAHRAGIKSGDEIIAVGGVDVKQIPSNKAVEKMRGTPGSKLELTILRKGEEQPLNFQLTREVIKIKSVRTAKLDDQIFYARITSFQESTSEELQQKLKEFKTIKGLIIDLRDNPGGLLDQAVRVSDLFIDSGLIVSTVGRDKKKVEREFAKKRGTFGGFPIVAIVNSGTASASEILAGALQDHERGMIIGSKTFGKGSVQTLLSLPDGTGLKLTVARYFTPKDRSIQAKGITPDIIVSDQRPDSLNSAEKQPRTERDLKGHIVGDDLSNLARKEGKFKAIGSWPDKMKNDFQVVTAFRYLKGWEVMQKNFH